LFGYIRSLVDFTNNHICFFVAWLQLYYGHAHQHHTLKREGIMVNTRGGKKVPTRTKCNNVFIHTREQKYYLIKLGGFAPYKWNKCNALGKILNNIYV